MTARHERVLDLGTVSSSLPLPDRYTPVAASRLPAWNWTTASVAVHLLFAVLLSWQFAARGKPQVPQRIQAVMIVKAAAPAAAPAQVAEPAPQPTPEPVKPKPLEPRPAPTPKPVTPPSKPQAKQESQAKASPPPAEKVGNEGESAFSLILDGVRGNWLQPAGPRIPFLCRFKIDYLPGGIISNVSQVQTCGSPQLDDSVMRAVWKTQPLPLDNNARGQAGSIVLEFTP